ncbi:fungal-specific transcription factor domain-containing protein [Mycena albidolilacea]|uniref:Fungal-specific transcription factor domain-containing protein n=1 Tax=Mycena albidolilacea TaxID=1033008 RepID=A0AAD6Z284_9AGAR|nr:fungal-specific transcription factor domain-containing protein [Mycena albidolilacea]
MSSEEDNAQESSWGKKRRVQRACDVCRRKKTACDGSPGDPCSTCIEANLDCTFVEASVKRPPPKSYLEMQAQLEHSEALVRQLRAELANAHFANSSSTTLSTSASNSPPETDKASGSNTDFDMPTAMLNIMRATLDSLTLPKPLHEEDLAEVGIADKFENLSMSADTGGHSHRFLGKSSGIGLVNAALNFKKDVNGDRYPEQSLGDHSKRHADTWTSRRLRYWTWKPLDTGGPMRRAFAFMFPSYPLMSELIDLYFTHSNMYLPLLHRPTFERSVAKGLHLRDDGFAGTLLLVCAIASRWSMDPATAEKGLECGWEWFDQVPLAGNRLLSRPTLYDLQHYCLAALFLEASSMPQAWWTLVGVGLRLAQDIGVHRRKGAVEVPTVESELYKRAFWVLLYLERTFSCSLGRTCSVEYDEFDIDPLIECDDEFWEHPTHPFQQPAGVPSRVTFFNILMRLNHILSFCLRMMYSLRKVPALCPFTDAWLEDAVADMDSALNKWRGQIPGHLRWDSTRKDPVFFDQSVVLLKSAPTALPSLAACTSAARACATLVDIQRQRTGNVTTILNLNAAFTSGLILLLKILSGMRTGMLPDSSRDMVHVHNCMEIVRMYEDRWQNAGMLDTLAELASVGRLPHPNSQTPAGPNSHSPYHNINRTGERASGQYADHPPSADDATSIFLGPQSSSQSFDPPLQFHAPYAPGPYYADGVGADPGMLQFVPSSFDSSVPFQSGTFQREEMLYPDPAQASRELESMMIIDSDAMAVWTNAPMGLVVDDWGAYFSNFNEIQGQTGQGSGWSTDQALFHA